MNVREIVNNLIKDKKASNAKMARAIGTTPQNLHNKLHRDDREDLKVNMLVSIANYLDYDVVLVPKSRSDKVGGIIIDGLEK